MKNIYNDKKLLFYQLPIIQMVWKIFVPFQKRKCFGFLPGLKGLKLDFHGCQVSLNFQFVGFNSFGLFFFSSSSFLFFQRQVVGIFNILDMFRQNILNIKENVLESSIKIISNTVGTFTTNEFQISSYLPNLLRKVSPILTCNFKVCLILCT